MYHSVTFGDKNTWDDWKLVAAERPFVAPPVPKTNMVDIPGASSQLDFSEELTGYPTFENRTGSLEFIITDQYDSYQEKRWQDTYSKIMAYISGRRLKMILEDDPNYFYEGRFYVEEFTPGASADDSFSRITINYDVGPYKWTVEDSLDANWLWDPFSFVDGVITSSAVKDLPIDSTLKTLELPKELIGVAPFCPEFIVTTSGGTNVILQIINQELRINTEKTVQAGTWTFYDVIFWADVITNSKTILKYRMASGGTGTLSLRYRKGGL